jgi:hypothetical protein
MKKCINIFKNTPFSQIMIKLVRIDVMKNIIIRIGYLQGEFGTADVGVTEVLAG